LEDFLGFERVPGFFLFGNNIRFDFRIHETLLHDLITNKKTTTNLRDGLANRSLKTERMDCRWRLGQWVDDNPTCGGQAATPQTGLSVSRE
jgi:hypothetical protein